MFADLHDRSIQRKIIKTAEELRNEPEKQGKPLYGEFEGLRRVRFSRYRIIYRADPQAAKATILALGLRKAGSRTDLYAMAAKLAKVGVLLPRE